MQKKIFNYYIMAPKRKALRRRRSKCVGKKRRPCKSTKRCKMTRHRKRKRHCRTTRNRRRMKRLRTLKGTRRRR